MSKGKRHWRVSADSDPELTGVEAMPKVGERLLVPGRTRPITYTVMPDFGGAWCWQKPAGDEGKSVGELVGSNRSWSGLHPIPQELVDDFSDWQLEFDRHASTGADASTYSEFRWREFHLQGTALCQRLKQLVGDSVQVLYDKPIEDPLGSNDSRLIFEMDGSFREIDP